MLMANTLTLPVRPRSRVEREHTLPRVVPMMKAVPGASARLQPTVYLPSLDQTRRRRSFSDR